MHDERVNFVREVQAGDESVADLCRIYGVSRKTGYKWLERYDREGVAGLADRSAINPTPSSPCERNGLPGANASCMPFSNANNPSTRGPRRPRSARFSNATGSPTNAAAVATPPRARR